jgi:hypothetical protein
MSTISPEEDRLLAPKKVRSRYGDVCDRTIRRWQDERGFPGPYRMNGRRFWKLSELIAFDQNKLKKGGA